MNSELCRKALERVTNPNVLINLVSKRVRQLNSGGGGLSRPLIANAETLGAGDVALTEILEERITFEGIPETPQTETASRRRKRV